MKEKLLFTLFGAMTFTSFAQVTHEYDPIAEFVSGDEFKEMTFEIEDSYLISEIEVSLNVIGVDGPGNSDMVNLDIALESPSGTMIQLIFDHCAGTLTNFYWVFDDDAATYVDEFCIPMGPVRPALNDPSGDPLGTSLSDFDDEDVNGTWKLLVHNWSNGEFEAEDLVIDWSLFIVEFDGVEENNPPTGISISSLDIDENLPASTIVGSFTSEDVDLEDTHVYYLVDGLGGDDNASFMIDGDNLVSSEVFNFEEKDSYNIRVRTDDGNGGEFEEMFIILINDIDDTAGEKDLRAEGGVTIYPNPFFSEPTKRRAGFIPKSQ